MDHMDQPPVLNVNADGDEEVFGPDPSPDIGYCSSPESSRAEVDVDSGAAQPRLNRSRDLQSCRVKVSQLPSANQEQGTSKTMKTASTMTSASFIDRHRKFFESFLLL